MSPAKVILIRASVVATLLLAMPLVVLPPVVAQIDSLFYRADPASLPLADRAARANFDSAQVSPIVQSAAPAKTDDDIDVRMAAAQARLQSLGVSYMTLEADGGDNRRFHFQCRVPFLDTLECGMTYRESEVFRSSHSDPLAAMEQVVREIEAWHDRMETAQLPLEEKRLR